MAQSTLWEKAQGVYIYLKKRKRKKRTYSRTKWNVISNTIHSISACFCLPQKQKGNQGSNAKQSHGPVLTINEKHKLKNLYLNTFLHTEDVHPVANTLSTPGNNQRAQSLLLLPGMTRTLLRAMLNITMFKQSVGFAELQKGVFNDSGLRNIKIRFPDHTKTWNTI